ncbi:LysR substrate-binding domain-containing protein [Tabrizicola oligotrophica]|uniref:LysR family transcriptional regulator n=1 Tax=Tabrizicola oligotrophica TaxID=2710650 RepID=A0A6M0QYY0_9RHOB|nr:LysR substrate-binding domain-containing protein [Tabrizicola oligotrophica]NEY91652.1 LysR family transcriptional regulator [Tabrizicola oligotrophica]
MLVSRRYLPSMPSLLALEAVDRLGSASAAAEELNLTQGAVSRQLQVLEGQLGVALFQRDKHRLKLTQGARDYCREVRRLLTGLGQATLTLRANPGGGALNLAILPAFGMHWLAPRLARFAGQHPEVTVNLSTRLKPFDFEASQFDAAIHYGRQDWPGVDYLPLMQEDMLAVAAPSLAPAPLPRPEDVLALPLLQLESRTGDWGRWLAHHGQAGLRPPAMLFDQFATMMQGAIHGLGAALMPTYLIQRELESGRLVPLYGPAIASTGSYYLVWPKDRAERAPLQSFRRWLKGEIG